MNIVLFLLLANPPFNRPVAVGHEEAGDRPEPLAMPVQYYRAAVRAGERLEPGMLVKMASDGNDVVLG